ncbi:MAG TPA: hypothetical protein VIR57_19745 [Chloroflexota bacterium]
MKAEVRRVLAVAALAVGLMPGVAKADGCVFGGAMAEFHNVIPDIVGNCVENQQPLAGTAYGFTQRTTKGLLVYGPNTSIKAEFTDGAHTWGFRYGRLAEHRGQRPHGPNCGPAE